MGPGINYEGKPQSGALGFLGLILFTSIVCCGQTPELVVQTGHAAFVSSVAFSPDRKTLARRGPMNSKGLAQLAYEKGMYILAAAQSYQAAQEAEKLGHGFLTYALVEDGLKEGTADREPKDGRIELREWLNYATDRCRGCRKRTRWKLCVAEADL